MENRIEKENLVLKVTYRDGTEIRCLRRAVKLGETEDFISFKLKLNGKEISLNKNVIDRIEKERPQTDGGMALDSLVNTRRIIYENTKISFNKLYLQSGIEKKELLENLVSLFKTKQIHIVTIGNDDVQIWRTFHEDTDFKKKHSKALTKLLKKELKKDNPEHVDKLIRDLILDE